MNTGCKVITALLAMGGVILFLGVFGFIMAAIFGVL